MHGGDYKHSLQIACAVARFWVVNGRVTGNSDRMPFWAAQCPSSRPLAQNASAQFVRVTTYTGTCWSSDVISLVMKIFASWPSLLRTQISERGPKPSIRMEESRGPSALRQDDNSDA